MSSFQDYIKFLTEQVVTYVEKPKKERKEMKATKRANRPPLPTHLFGLLPVAVSFLWKSSIKRKINDE